MSSSVDGEGAEMAISRIQSMESNATEISVPELPHVPDMSSAGSRRDLTS